MAHKYKTQSILWRNQRLLYVRQCTIILETRHIVQGTIRGPTQGRLLGKVKKAITIWKLPPDFWKAVQKGMQFYIYNPHKRKVQEENAPPTLQAPTPFQPTLNNARNLLRQAYLAQSTVEWEIFMKGRIVRQWETYIAFHIRQKQIGLPAKEWAAELIMTHSGTTYIGYGHSGTGYSIK
jgi:hypothetical protein